MVNINVIVPDTLHKELKIAAAISESTIKDIVHAALTERTRKGVVRKW